MTLKPGPMPLYHQIVQDLTGQLTRRKLKPGDALPTEEQLCERYGVSRITVRRALDDLIVGGLVVRRRGVGTFVAEPHEASRSVSLVGSLYDALAYPKGMTIQHLEQGERKAEPWVVRSLSLEATDPVVHWDLLSRVDGTPFAATTFFFPVEIGRGLSTKDLRADTPVAKLVEKQIGEPIVRAEQTVAPVSTDGRLSELLEIPRRSAVLKVERVYFTASGTAVECAAVHYRPDQYQLRIELLQRDPRPRA